jgi:hypothetical protein
MEFNVGSFRIITQWVIVIVLASMCMHSCHTNNYTWAINYICNCQQCYASNVADITPCAIFNTNCISIAFGIAEDVGHVTNCAGNGFTATCTIGADVPCDNTNESDSTINKLNMACHSYCSYFSCLYYYYACSNEAMTTTVPAIIATTTFICTTVACSSSIPDLSSALSSSSKFPSKYITTIVVVALVSALAIIMAITLMIIRNNRGMRTNLARQNNNSPANDNPPAYEVHRAHVLITDEVISDPALPAYSSVEQHQSNLVSSDDNLTRNTAIQNVADEDLDIERQDDITATDCNNTLEGSVTLQADAVDLLINVTSYDDLTSL